MKINQTFKVMEATLKAVAVTAVCLGYGAQSVMAASTLATNQSSTKAIEEIKIVPTLGYTNFNITGTSESFSSKGGNSAAVLAQMPILGGQVELETGLEYMETGAKKSLDLGVFSLDALTLSVQQLAIPLRAKYVFNPRSSGTHWYGKGGLTPTYVMGAKMKSFTGDSADVKSEMNSFGAFAQAGGGADWKMDYLPGRLNMDFIYSYGLTKAFKEDGGRSAGFQIQAGYTIEL